MYLHLIKIYQSTQVEDGKLLRIISITVSKKKNLMSIYWVSSFFCVWFFNVTYMKTKFYSPLNRCLLYSNSVGAYIHCWTEYLQSWITGFIKTIQGGKTWFLSFNMSSSVFCYPGIWDYRNTVQQKYCSTDIQFKRLKKACG